MHDTLDYMQLDPIYRRYHHDKMTFEMLYNYTENFVLPLSHDEVVHGKNRFLTGCWRCGEVRQPARLLRLAVRLPGEKAAVYGQ